MCGNDRDGVVISLDPSKTIQFGSSASDEGRFPRVLGGSSKERNGVRHVQDMTHDVTRALIRHDERENRRKEQIITIGYVKIMWGFMQTLNAFVHVFRVRWPSLLWRLFQTFGFTGSTSSSDIQQPKKNGSQGSFEA